MHEMPYYGVKYAVESMCIGHGQGAAAIWDGSVKNKLKRIPDTISCLST
jgi:hypothetical protein